MISGSGASVGPYLTRIDKPGDRQAKLQGVIVDRMASNEIGTSFGNLVAGALQNIDDDLFGQSRQRKCQNTHGCHRSAAHGINIAERIGGSDFTEKLRGIDDWREEIQRLYQSSFFIDPVDGSIVEIPAIHHQCGVRSWKTDLLQNPAQFRCCNLGSTPAFLYRLGQCNFF